MIDINKEIAQLNWNKEPRGLYEPIEYTLASGGKRLRPHLAIIAAERDTGRIHRHRAELEGIPLIVETLPCLILIEPDPNIFVHILP